MTAFIFTRAREGGGQTRVEVELKVLLLFLSRERERESREGKGREGNGLPGSINLCICMRLLLSPLCIRKLCCCLCHLLCHSLLIVVTACCPPPSLPAAVAEVVSHCWLFLLIRISCLITLPSLFTCCASFWGQHRSVQAESACQCVYVI